MQLTLEQELQKLAHDVTSNTLHDARTHILALLENIPSPIWEQNAYVAGLRTELLQMPGSEDVAFDHNVTIDNIVQAYARQENATDVGIGPATALKEKSPRRIRNPGAHRAAVDFVTRHPEQYITHGDLYDGLKPHFPNLTQKDVTDALYQMKRGIRRVPGGRIEPDGKTIRYIPDGNGTAEEGTAVDNAGEIQPEPNSQTYHITEHDAATPGKNAQLALAAAPAEPVRQHIKASPGRVSNIFGMYKENPVLHEYVGKDYTDLAVSARNMLAHPEEIELFYKALMAVCDGNKDDSDRLDRMTDYLRIVRVKGDHAIPLIKWILECPENLGKALDEQFLDNDRLGERTYKPKLHTGKAAPTGFATTDAPNTRASRILSDGIREDEARADEGARSIEQAPCATVQIRVEEAATRDRVKHDAVLALVTAHAYQRLDEAIFVKMLTTITQGFPSIDEKDAAEYFSALRKGDITAPDGVLLTGLAPNSVDKAYMIRYVPLSGKTPIAAHLPRIKTMGDVYQERPDFRAYFEPLGGFHSDIVAARAALKERKTAEEFYNALANLERAYSRNPAGRGRARTDFLKIASGQRAAGFVHWISRDPAYIAGAFQLYGEGVINLRYDPTPGLSDYATLQPVSTLGVMHSVIS
ncbi:MAG: hypothetical protein HY365_00560 [Candidatus Aenigmarchaeota archaeon]|nr:hypothetical protein [Candidatus Aenigmarchaeota archaeon]